MGRNVAATCRMTYRGTGRSGRACRTAVPADIWRTAAPANIGAAAANAAAYTGRCSCPAPADAGSRPPRSIRSDFNQRIAGSGGKLYRRPECEADRIVSNWLVGHNPVAHKRPAQANGKYSFFFLSNQSINWMTAGAVYMPSGP
jgi:hypothetical protein